MAHPDISGMIFGKIYPLYVQKAERKGKTKEQVDTLIRWLTGYDQAGLESQIETETTLKEFFDEAPQLHPNRTRITGLICGYRVEEIEDPLIRNARYMDKLIDELARGKKFENIMRPD